MHTFLPIIISLLLFGLTQYYVFHDDIFFLEKLF